MSGARLSTSGSLAKLALARPRCKCDADIKHRGSVSNRHGLLTHFAVYLHVLMVRCVRAGGLVSLHGAVRWEGR